MRDLSEVLDWIEVGNKTLFNPLDTQATLYLFDNQYYETSKDEGNFKQRCRSFPMEAVVFDSLPEIYEAMVKFTRDRILTGNSEIRLGLVFRPLDLAKKNKLVDRIR